MAKPSRTAMSVITIRSKLTSLQYFCPFVLKELVPNSVDPDLSSNLNALQAVLPAWRQSLIEM